MPTYLMMGVSQERFEDSTPLELKPYEKAYTLRQKQNDQSMWQMGMYVLSAVQTAVEHCLAGRKAKSKYIKAPFSSKGEDLLREENLTEDEKKQQRKALLEKLKIMQKNFELNHKAGTK